MCVFGVGGRVQLRSIQYGRCPEAVAGGEGAHAGYYEDAERADGGGHQMVKEGGEASGKEENLFTNLLCNIGMSLIFVIICYNTHCMFAALSKDPMVHEATNIPEVCMFFNF